ncbi:hypothetical protein RHSIM_Rhsim05G0142300 [Rhododendron simsii]|uniref:Peroxisomal adenine nucleotide carrier 1 n=1 Tax=Rhododendron simsii TaxID=118357 RepID=A0A834GX76_RHOSS|nr:hypothetical protein RHSIM_Rhsim05G0142300 [Rhododendron simsii]
MSVDLESLSEATSGAIGALLSTTILYPLDTCKTKYQAEVQAHGQQKYRSIIFFLSSSSYFTIHRVFFFGVFYGFSFPTTFFVTSAEKASGTNDASKRTAAKWEEDNDLAKAALLSHMQDDLIPLLRTSRQPKKFYVL